MSINPYNISAPVVGPQLFGREALLSSIMHALDPSLPRVIIIFGPPRLGKTSILRELENRLAAQTYVPVYFEHRDGSHLSSEGLLQALAQTIAEKVGLPVSELKPLSKPDDFHTNFLPQVRQKIAPQQLALLLDDIDTLKSEQAGILIPYFQKLIENKQPVTLVLSTRTKLQNLPAAFQSMSRVAYYEEIPFLAPQETIALITKPAETEGVEYTPKVSEIISHLSAGHPYFAQLIGYETFEQTLKNQDRQVDVDTLNVILPTVLEKITPILHPLVADLSEGELNVLAAGAGVAGQSKFITPKAIEEILRKHRIIIEERELNKILDKLQQRNLLKRDMQGVFSFIIPLIARWVLYKYALTSKASRLPLSKWNLVVALATLVITVGAGLFFWNNLTPQNEATPTVNLAAAKETPTAQSESIAAPTEEPTPEPTPPPTQTPTQTPTATPWPQPTETPTSTPTEQPTEQPSQEPTATSTPTFTATPTQAVVTTPTQNPSLEVTSVALPEGLHFLDLEVAGGGPSILVYGVAKDEGIYQRSANGSWSLFSANLGDGIKIRSLGVRDASAQNITLYAGYSDGVRRWSQAEGWSAKASFPRFHDFVTIPNSSIVFAGSDKGVYRSIDDGRTWQAMNLGLSGRIIEVAIFSLALGRNSNDNWTLYAAGADTAFIFKTTIDPAQEASKAADEPRWEDIICQCEGRDTFFAIATDPVNTQNVYVGNDRSRISFSPDGGATWTTTVVPVGGAQEVFITDLEVAPANSVAYAATGSDLAAYASNGILIRTGPGNWAAVKPPRFIQGRDYVTSIAIDPANPQVIYVGGANGLFKFDNSAQTWIPSP